MTIHRSLRTSAAGTMEGDFVRIAGSSGIHLVSAPGLSLRFGLMAPGMIGKIKQEDGELRFVRDDRTPSLLRNLGKIHLSPEAQVERVSVDNDYEKAILSLEYLFKLSEQARQTAAFQLAQQPAQVNPRESSEVARGIMIALMDTAAKSDLDLLLKELSAAGIEQVQIDDTMIDVRDAARVSEMLVAPERSREEVQPAPSELQPEVAQPDVAQPALAPTAAAYSQALGMAGTNATTLTVDDVRLGDDAGDDVVQDPDTPGM